MSVFKKTLNDEISDLINYIDNLEERLDKNWSWQDKRLTGLMNLEQADLSIIRKLQYLHRAVKTNSEVSQRIIQLASEFKEKLEELIKLSGIQKNMPKDNLALAKKMTEELKFLIRAEVNSEKLIRGMTTEQIQKLGIKIKSFYVAAGPRLLRLITEGKGEWPTGFERANLGIGVYAFDSLKDTEKYGKRREEEILEKTGEKANLKIVRLTFSEASLRDFKEQGKEIDLRELPPDEYDEWMTKHSSYGEENVSKDYRIKKPFLHEFLHVINPRELGTEHYFRPECLSEAVIELVS